MVTLNELSQHKSFATREQQQAQEDQLLMQEDQEDLKKKEEEEMQRFFLNAEGKPFDPMKKFGSIEDGN